MRWQKTHSFDDQVRALGQKYMGYRPQPQGNDFQDTSLKGSAGHDVLVDNFMNAQCMVFRLIFVNSS